MASGIPEHAAQYPEGLPAHAPQAASAFGTAGIPIARAVNINAIASHRVRHFFIASLLSGPSSSHNLLGAGIERFGAASYPTVTSPVKCPRTSSQA